MLVAVMLVMILQPSIVTIVGVLVLKGWVRYARLVRGQTLSVKEDEFVLAARAIGASSGRIVFRHILPNVTNVALVITTLEMGTMILFEAGLSFLGLGVQPPAPTWGTMLSDGRSYLTSAWWITLFPGIAISITALGVNVVGDVLQEILDPRMRSRYV
jgi:peptide/nickel transport system permease protein